MMQLNACIYFNHELGTKMSDTRVVTCELDISSLDSKRYYEEYTTTIYESQAIVLCHWKLILRH